MSALPTGLQGKTALITGGSSGIGRGIALVLAQEGVDLAIASRRPDPGVISEMSSYGVRCVRIEADISQEHAVVQMVKQAIDSFGHLDLYVNNAAWTWHQPITKIDTASWYKTLDTNLSSCMWACREVGKHMITNRKGSILIIGSTVCANPAYQETSYRISKMGLRMYMQNLAIEMAPYGIRVNMITPGYFRTRMTSGIAEAGDEELVRHIPARRPGNAIEIGNAAALLLSDELSGYTYGADLVIDGGLTLRPLPSFSEEAIIAMNLE